MQVRLLIRGCVRFVLICALALAALPVWAGARYKVLHSFTNGADGGTPWFNAALDSKGNLYGVTFGGGPQCQTKKYCGIVFELARQVNGRWTEKIVHSFTTRGEGDGPNGGPALDSKGSLYGAALDGPNGTAALYQLVPRKKAWSYRLIYDQGAGLSVVFDKADNIYGYLGAGRFKCGAVSELSPDPSTWIYKELYSFCSQQGGADGWGPHSPLIWDAAGNLYGTTVAGGKYNWGVAFEITP